ncbi:MAG TPA: serine/threonine-protein kinase [Polyangiaceae bacterium]|nr:serine/threonine-protein kinase [Polyangiaceae bacterium]
MRGRPNPVEALATLVRLQDDTERRANFRQAITALGQSSGASGPPPLDGIAPEVLSRAMSIALDSGLVDNLEWIAAGPAAVALYEITAALPQGKPRRELGRRVFARVYDGTAGTFAAVAARMALSSGKPLEAAQIRARISLLFDLPVGSSVNADALALTLVTRRELRERWLDRARSGTLPARRLAAKLIEHAAREAVVRAQQGDPYPKDLLLAEPVRSIFQTLLADREPLVWRHAAVARGLLSAVDSGLREEIDSALDPNLSPTEWRRAGVSLVGTLPSDPDGASRACKRLIEGPIAQHDPGIVATLVMGLPRAIEAEPDTAEAVLDAIAATRRPDVAEAVATLLSDLTSQTFGEDAAKVLRKTLASRAQAPGSVLRGVAERTIRILDREQDEDTELVGAVRRALVAYETRGARAAHELAISALAAGHRAMDFIGSHDPHDLQVLPYVVGALADLDLGVLETPRLSDLLLLGRRPGDNDASLPEVDRLYDRLGSWVLEAESSVEQAQHSNGAALGEQRRLKALLHLVDLEGARGEDDLGVRGRVLRAVQVMLRRLASRPDSLVNRIACATLARSFDSAVREGVAEPSDLLLALAHFLSEPQSFESIAEASTNPEVRAVLEAYVAFLNPHAEHDHAEGSVRPTPLDDAERVAARVLRLSRGLGAGGAYRGEALRRVMQRLGRSLQFVAQARGQTELIENSDGERDVLNELGHALDDLRRLISGALRRVVEEDPMAISVDADVPPLAGLVDRTVRSGVPPTAQQLTLAINELVVDLPVALASAVSQVLDRIASLPVEIPSDVYAVPLETRRTALPDWLLPQKTIGAFYVVRALGGGGASSVFVARRIEERKNAKAQGFALKVPAYDPTTARSLSEQEFLQLFREEAGALLSLPQHVNLARFVTFDLAARPKPILVMELIAGSGLDRLLRSRALSSDQAFKILDGILAGVEAMHGASVGHLDLKPSNVILRDGHVPVLVDFGLSGRKLRPGCGTLDYCSPEVLGSAPADYVPSPLPADIYAFACMAYETLTGQLLFEADDETAILAAHVSHDGWPDRLARFAQIPEYRDLAMVLAACLRQDPRKRPTVRQARTALAKASKHLHDRPWPLSLDRPRTELSA